MTASTAFGPQGANALTSTPSANYNGYGTVDTWVKDCTSPLLNDGTVLNAQFFNNIIGNLRYAVRSAGVTLQDGDQTMLYRAVQASAAAAAIAAVANQNILWANVKNRPSTIAGYGITDAAPLSHVGAGGSAHVVASQTIAGFMSTTDKARLDNLAPVAIAGTYASLTGTPPIATNSALGTIIAGSNLTITAGGVLSIVSANVIAALGYTPLNPSALGVNNGVAMLDSSGKLPASQIPAALVGALQYQGGWNASSNSPALTSGSGVKGQMYKVTTAGTTTIDGISQWVVGDYLVFDGTTWDKFDGNPNEVLSVAGMTGVIAAAALKSALAISVSDISGLGVLATLAPGSGVATALATAIGTSGAPVVYNGALGTPSAAVLTNGTGLPWSSGVVGKPTTIAGYGITDGLTAAAAAGIYMPQAGGTFTGNVHVTSTTTASWTDQGALTVAGGMGIGGSVMVGIGLRLPYVAQYGGLTANNGSVEVFGLQSLSNTGDNGRLYLASGGSTNVDIRASGTSFFNGGNVAIGKTSASYALDVTGDVNLTGALRIGGASFVSVNTSGVATFASSPLAPTPAAGTNNTQLATTAFVASAVTSSVAGVASFNSRTGSVTFTAADISAAVAAGNITKNVTLAGAADLQVILNSSSGSGWLVNTSPGALNVWNQTNSDTVFATNNVEKMRLYANGGLALGALLTTSVSIQLGGVAGTATNPWLDWHSSGASSLSVWDFRHQAYNGNTTTSGQGDMYSYGHNRIHTGPLLSVEATSAGTAQVLKTANYSTAAGSSANLQITGGTSNAVMTAYVVQDTTTSASAHMNVGSGITGGIQFDSPVKFNAGISGVGYVLTDNGALAVGSTAFCYCGVNTASGATIAGSNLQPAVWNGSSNAWQTTTSTTGTWRNISGANVTIGNYGLFQRIS